MRLALVKSSKSVSAQSLQDAHINISVVVAHECFALKFYVTAERAEIMIEQLLAQFRWQVRLGVVQKRSNIVLQRAFATALIIHEERLAVAQQDVARLKVAIEKIITGSAQQKIRQAAKIVFKRLLAEGNARQPKKIIFEVVQVPRDGLPVEAPDRVAHFIVQVAAGFRLKSRQHSHSFAVSFHHERSDVVALAIYRQKLEKSRVSKVFFEISALVQVFAINFRHG